MAIDIFEALWHEIVRSYEIWTPEKALTNNSADIARWKEKGGITQEQAYDLEEANRRMHWAMTQKGGQDVQRAAEG